MRAIVLFKEGYEEVEALGTVDILRRAKIQCDMVGMDDIEVKSSHDITIKMDKIFDESDNQADVVVLPGGIPGAASLRDDQRVVDLVSDFYHSHKVVAAICAAPIVLQRAGILTIEQLKNTSEQELISIVGIAAYNQLYLKIKQK